jgi:hypothetical protein
VQGHGLFKQHFHYAVNVLVSSAKCRVSKPALYPSPWSWEYHELSAILPSVDRVLPRTKSFFVCLFVLSYRMVQNSSTLSRTTHKGQGSARYSSVVSFAFWYLYIGYLTDSCVTAQHDFFKDWFIALRCTIAVLFFWGDAGVRVPLNILWI